MSKEYNCPDCFRTDSCENCSRIDNKKTNNTKKLLHIPPDFPDSSLWNNVNIPECCKHCSNHPSNNGGRTFLCNCTLPYLEMSKTPNTPNVFWEITTQTGTGSDYIIYNSNSVKNI